MKFLHQKRSLLALLAAFLSCWAAIPAQATGQKKNPASKIYIADVEGQAVINDGEKINDLAKQSVYLAQGSTIHTEEDSYSSTVLSNGSGIFLSPDSRLQISKFVQEPFLPNRTDMNVEPSISSTNAYLYSGSVGLCNSKLVAGSQMIYQTPNATINIRGQKLVIKASEKGTTVSVLQGSATVKVGRLDFGGNVIKPGQQAFIPSSGGGIQIHSINDKALKGLQEQVAAACVARKSVYFEVRDQKSVFNQDSSAGQEIVPVPTTPAEPDTEYVTSAANITQ